MRFIVIGIAVVASAAVPSAAARPPGPPPTVPGVRSAPPPAWIETRRADKWLAFSSYCWTVTCIDSRPFPDRTDIPRIVVSRGEIVRFHLGFQPATLTMRLAGRTFTLAAARVSSWRVRGATGYGVLKARTTGKLRAEYVARFVLQ